MTQKADPGATRSSRGPLIVIGLLLGLAALMIGGIALYSRERAATPAKIAQPESSQPEAAQPKTDQPRTAEGQAAVAPGKKADRRLWAKNCAKEAAGPQVCYVEQFAISNPGNVIVLHVQIGYMATDGKPTLVISVPLGTPIQPGLQLVLDGGKPIALPLTLCQAGGCVASANLEPAVLEQFTKGKVLMVRYAKPDRSTLDVPVQLTGLRAALDTLGPPPAAKPGPVAQPGKTKPAPTP